MSEKISEIPASNKKNISKNGFFPIPCLLLREFSQAVSLDLSVRGFSGTFLGFLMLRIYSILHSGFQTFFKTCLERGLSRLHLFLFMRGFGLRVRKRKRKKLHMRYFQFFHLLFRYLLLLEFLQHRHLFQSLHLGLKVQRGSRRFFL